MRCKNIIIISVDNSWFDEEVSAIIRELTGRYQATASVTTYEFDGVDLTKADGTGTPDAESADTGVYMLVHGDEAKGLQYPLNSPTKAEKFAAALLSLADLRFQIRKLCFLTCCGVEMVGANPVLPEQSATVEKIFVQHACQAISKIDNKTPRKLEGLMVAAYTKGVYVTKDEKNPNHPIKTTQPGKLDLPMRPALKAKSLPSKLQKYAEHKRIFVWENGNWRLGSLLEYSDKWEWAYGPDGKRIVGKQAKGTSS